ncbi:MAG: hypothetical protein QOD81_1287, partial [Solirubrobacteraceae bacterium]|nr:hypothetical protein [Solirubrobacteraceae bacterium]
MHRLLLSVVLLTIGAAAALAA